MIWYESQHYKKKKEQKEDRIKRQRYKTKGVFTPVTPVWFDWIELVFSPWCGSFGQVWIQQYSTKQPYRDPAEEVVSVRFQINSGTVEWMNQWMNDNEHKCVFVYSFWFTCKKGSVKANGTKQNKKINIVFGPDQSKWTSIRSSCEYTLRELLWMTIKIKNIG